MDIQSKYRVPDLKCYDFVVNIRIAPLPLKPGMTVRTTYIKTPIT
jgi:hypothetical protein